MKLTEAECWDRIGNARRGVLSTVHPDRGADAVPVVFVAAGGRVFIPIDTVKPKRTHRLQRLANVALDSRATLLVDHWEEDWERLWWVRVSGTAGEATVAEREGFLESLLDKYPQYAADDIVNGLVLTVGQVTGWTARQEP